MDSYGEKREPVRIELIEVVGILAAEALPRWSGYVAKGQDTADLAP